MKNFYIALMGYLYYLLLVIVNKSLRLQVLGANNYYSLKGKTNIIFIFWHQATFVPLYLYRGQKACIITSKSTRGEILTRAAERFGYKIERITEGEEKTSDRIRSLIGILKVLKQGYDTNLAVDGPLGPLHKIKPGAIFLAVKSGLPLLPVAVAAKRKIVFSFRWDRYFIPLPFTKVAIGFGEPIYLPKELSEESYQSTIRELEGNLFDLTKKAEEAL